MTESVSDIPLGLPRPLKYWRGLSGWNYYFLIKLLLLRQGLLNYHPVENLAFAAFILLPLPPRWLHRLRHIVALPLGLSLFYYDTWLPPFNHLLSQVSVLESFSADYLRELAIRLIPFEWISPLLILLLLYLFLSQWVRFSALIVAILFYLVLANHPLPLSLFGATAKQTPQAGLSAETTSSSMADDASLDASLNDFFKEQSKLTTDFPAATEAKAPFDLLIINVCSLAWSDVRHVGMMDHPLFKDMDLIFDRFSSAASYSGPAAIRVLRASCGQPPHQTLFEPTLRQCYLFDHLERLGYRNSIALNHDGHFDHFLDYVRQQGLTDATLVSTKGMTPALTAFDGSAIYDDGSVLSRWWQQRNEQASPRAALFYNTITLHDGNRVIDTNSGKSIPAPYGSRLDGFFNDLLAFIQQVEQSGRPVVLVMVPEHGAALKGSRMQIAGMRELPTPGIIQVPVAVKLINTKIATTPAPLHIAQPSSYLAISELIARLARGKTFVDPDTTIEQLVDDLPQTREVAQHDDTVLMHYQGRDYLRMDKDHWQPVFSVKP